MARARANAHEMGFAREVCDNVVFMADGEVVETGHPDVIFGSPAHDRTKDFIARTRTQS